jgi:hypothetical protein
LVPQVPLDRLQLGAGHEQVGGARVPQLVRRQADAQQRLGAVGDGLEDRARQQRRAAPPEPGVDE